ncbi:MAG: carbamoyl-phosphate synthase (glutamine-hydrolyzing) large subunit [Candidatus Bathyarchaeota archaeon]|uniref:carbamoyl-phosphate synthase (glutamine-hydrolyzing) large subunit n=1 Tax=Candidatus Bathycorpusculum sp. TaxID=2994959 RepID=UPI002823EA2E|nr:carbamoyl-phosphate synthase (glutamine-hydrolyzing) large subunit [Candidatus Termiticorpusculum sp.]MCL2256718.1 carbamoyl-phosphate synthase (glutamine-hydrolyzing) large subunit [Candidatus Termiticorpusculum sp.]MCL2292201.1 carbamoyl-phosphate synthase (glutamine-hydrolyzing) large subunit [Candidatus Termiticorpusculum sp.]
MPKFDWIHKVLVLGSGAIKIGEAAEFDYSGSQCLKALHEEGIETVLINPNIATIQTDTRLSGKVYLLPVTPDFVEKVIAKERPDGILLGFGGQTALNCGIELAKTGILDKYNVKVLGTSIAAIEDTGDRERFRQSMLEADVSPLKSRSATSLEAATQIADEIGYPVIVRVAYTLGGKGSGVAHNVEELGEIVTRGIAQSRIGQVLVEEYVGHWKEIEYEVMRDYADNCLTICNMENFDPMGVHTGDSIVVAPSQTMTNRECHKIRQLSINAIRHLNIVGECNIQWALNTQSEECRVIEVNSRMSRSSALASKVTGYPLAYIATKLTLGYLLSELTNKVTEVTTACFEPALDYVTIKVPRWDLQKFQNADRHVGPQMRSVGEVMAIGRCFEEALQKATRMLDIGKIGLVCNPEDSELESEQHIRDELANPTDERLFKISKALRMGLSISEIYRLSGIDPFFLSKIKNILNMEDKLRKLDINDCEAAKIIREAKRIGFSDMQIAVCQCTDEVTVRNFRKNAKIIPSVKQIDTLAAEYPAKINYLYMTYGGDEDDIDLSNNNSKVLVLGAGVFRIGSSVEFDWCAVNTIWALKRNGVKEAIMINYNPETVSTDYDVSDKLYFEELTTERIMDIYDKENPLGIITSVGGQIPNNLSMKLTESGANIIGTSAQNVDLAEDRNKFSSLLDKLGISQPLWSKLVSIDDTKLSAEKIGYPVIVRPSYVLSGSAMRVAYDEVSLENFLNLAAKVSRDHPVVISKFITGAKEVEVDGVCDGDNVLIGAIMEHVENAGVHSGDATMTIPPQALKIEVQKDIEDCTKRIVKALNIRGPYNIQYLVKDDVVNVIECNLRASRSMPFVSKTRGINLIEQATLVMLGKKINVQLSPMDTVPHVGVKVPQFSFMRLSGADPVLGVEMLSTGEVACIGETFSDAFSKALQAAEVHIPPKDGAILISVGGGQENKKRVIPIAKAFQEMNFRIFATANTANVLTASGVNATILYKVKDAQVNPNILDYLQERKIDLVINVPVTNSKTNYSDTLTDGYIIRRQAVEFNVPVITNLQLAAALVDVLKKNSQNEQTICSLNEYMDKIPWKYW